MQLKILTPSISFLVLCDDKATVESLLYKVSELIDTDPNHMVLIGGFPPRDLNINSLISDSIRDNDAVKVRFLPSHPDPNSNYSIIQLIENKSLTQKSNKGKRKIAMTLSSEEDVGFDLLDALEKGSKGKKNMFLKSVFRKAVSLQYDQSKAEARIASIVSGKYQFKEPYYRSSSRSDQTTVYKVIFDKGSGFRGNYEDDFELLDNNKLKGVISLLIDEYGLEETEDRESARDMLKPVNMAKCSPRVFWSLVKNHGPDLNGALASMFPNHDWSFLYQRKKLLSEKAKENKAQKKGGGGTKQNSGANQQKSSSDDNDNVDETKEQNEKNEISIYLQKIEPILESLEFSNLIGSLSYFPSDDALKIISDKIPDTIDTIINSIYDQKVIIPQAKNFVYCLIAVEIYEIDKSTTNEVVDGSLLNELKEVVINVIIRNMSNILFGDADATVDEINQYEEAFKYLLVKSKMKSLKQLNVWRHSPDFIFKKFSQLLEDSVYKELSSCGNDSSFKDRISELLSACKTFCDLFDWVEMFILPIV